MPAFSCVIPSAAKNLADRVLAARSFAALRMTAWGVALLVTTSALASEFTGDHFAGSGDTEYLQLLDIAARQFTPDPEFQNLSMLYEPSWNGLVEGPTW